MDGSDSIVSEELRRCSCCEVRRPLWAFGEYKRAGREGQLTSECRGCQGAGSAGKLAKAAGLPLEAVQAAVNERIDIIRARDLHEPFDMSKHRPEVKTVADKTSATEPLPDIPKLCMFCEEVRGHRRRDRARRNPQLRSSAGMCRGCAGAGLDKKPWREIPIPERRRLRDVAMCNAAEDADRRKRGVGFCSIGKHEAPLKHFPSRENGGTHRSYCRYCAATTKARKRGALMLEGEALFASNESRYLASKAAVQDFAEVEKSFATKQVPPPRVTSSQTVQPPPRPPKTKDESEIITHPVRRVSKGAIKREIKRQKWAEQDKAIANRALTDDDFVIMDEDSAVEEGVRAVRGAAQRTQGRERQITKKDPWRAVNISRGEIRTLIRKAISEGVKFYHRPRGWQGMWPFRPSPDKIDVTGGYTRENLRYVSWLENRARGADAIAVFERWLRDKGITGDVKALSDSELAAECKRRGLRDPRQLEMFPTG